MELLRVEVNGLSVSYRRTGQGPAIVLLHGFTQDSRVWRPQLADLADQFTVIAWDAPGAGQSSDPSSSFTIGDWAETLAGMLDKAGVARAHVVGLSWGGLLAQEFYNRYSGRVTTLILSGSYAGWKGSLTETVAQQRLVTCVHDSSLSPKELVSIYLPGMFGGRQSPDVADELAAIMADTHPLGFRLMAAALAEADTRERLRNIRVPTLLLWGAADKRSPLSVGRDIQNLIPGATLEVIPEVGHLSNLEAPARFNAILRDFLTRDRR